MNQTDFRPPFFIVGSGRSGTTLLQVLIDAHPDIAVPPESHLFYRFPNAACGYGDLRQPKNLQRLSRDLLSDKKIAAWNLEISVEEFCSRVKEKSFSGVVSLVFGLYGEKQGKKRWGDKTPRHALHLKEIKEIFPRAQIIHLVRDGRDVAFSYYGVYFGPKRIDKIAEMWRECLNAVEEFKRGARPEEFLEIKYEDLVEDPNREMKKVCDFLGERYFEIDDKVPETGAKSFYLKDKTSHGSLKDPITNRKIGSFQTGLSLREIEIFETLAKEELTRYGYRLTTAADARLTRMEKISFWLKDLQIRTRNKLPYLTSFGPYFQRLGRNFRKSLGF